MGKTDKLAMAIDDELLKRRKAKRAEEDEAERARSEKKQTTESTSTKSPFTTEEGDSPEMVVERLDDNFRRAEVMIDQLNGMYLAFVRGIDTQSPLPRRLQLETLMSALNNFPKPTPIYRFKFYNLLSSYTQHRDRWDKLLKDAEAGKIPRVKKTKGPFRRNG